jgi:phage shock protein E
VAPDKHASIMLCCASGARSGMACGFLQQQGYTQVVNGGGAGAVALQLNRPIDRL